jgi:hypothetical protein
MQDVQNIPNPDVNSNARDEDFSNHPRDNQDIEQPNDQIPLPPDQEGVPIENPPDANDKPPIEEEQNEPKRIV